MAVGALMASHVNAQASSGDALLVIAHGARTPGWNERVIRMAENIDWTD